MISRQVSDLLIVATDARGYFVAEEMAKIGWNVVLAELSGTDETKDLEWADRLGPCVSKWSEEKGDEAEKFKLQNQFYYWGDGGPQLLSELGRNTAFEDILKEPQRYSKLSLALELINSELVRPERTVQRFRDRLGDESVRKIIEQLISSPGKITAISSMVQNLRDRCLRAGVRVIDVESISRMPVRDQHIDRVNFITKSEDGSAKEVVERTRAVLWLLAEEELRNPSYVRPELVELSDDQYLLERVKRNRENELALVWWRNRIAIESETVDRAGNGKMMPALPQSMILVGSEDRPLTHSNFIFAERVDGAAEPLIYDVWIRLPIWSRSDHVYRDEQRTLLKQALQNKIPAIRVSWITPSPIALSTASVRLPISISYVQSELEGALKKFDSIANKIKKGSGEKIENLINAGPETWPAIGIWGAWAATPIWKSHLLELRQKWDRQLQSKQPKGQMTVTAPGAEL